MRMPAACPLGTALATIEMPGVLEGFRRQESTIATRVGAFEFFLKIAFGIHGEPPWCGTILTVDPVHVLCRKWREALKFTQLPIGATIGATIRIRST
jgi:hypothetical protein